MESRRHVEVRLTDVEKANSVPEVEREIPTFNDTSEPRRIASSVIENGIAVVDAAATPHVGLLRAEFDFLIQHPPRSTAWMTYPGGTEVKLTRSEISGRSPELYSFFSQEWMHCVASILFAENTFAYNHDVICVVDTEQTTHAAKVPHYDRTPNLKFFLYLTDVTDADGPFTCFPGTHRWAKTAQAENREARMLPTQMDTRELPAHLLSRDPQPIVGPAGTMIVVDSDTVHFGGVVSQGHLRKAVRSRSYLVDYV